MGGEFDGGGGLFQGKLMGNDLADVQFSGKNQPRDFLLQGIIGGIAAEQVFFVDADTGQVRGRIDAAPGMGEEQNLPTSADQLAGLGDGGV